MGRLADPDTVLVEQRADEPLEALSSATTTDPSSGPRQRRQSTISLRGTGSGSGSATTPNQPTPGPLPGTTSQDDIASDDEETEIISATLISFDVEATDPSPDPTNPASATGNGGAADNTTPGIWSAELRPNIAESNAHHPGDGHGDHDPDCSHYNPQDQHEPAYRENALTRLPSILATDVLAVTPARLLMMPFAATVWLSLARPYMARAGMAMEGVVSGGAGWWWLGGVSSGRALVNLLGLELLLAVMHGEVWAVVMLMAERFRWSEEEWNEREGVGEDGEEEGQGEGGNG
jgi:hypothetical protein